MNIGIFTDTYYPQINGVVTSIRMLENELRKLGHKVYIFAPKDPKARGLQEKNVYRLPSMPFIFLPSHRMVFFYPPNLLLKIKKFNLDIVHTHTEFPIGIFGKIVSEVYKVPMVHTYHTMYEDYVHYIARGHLISPKTAQKFSRIFCNRAKMVIAPTEKTKNSLLKYGVTKPIKTVPTGITINSFAKENYSIEKINDLRNSLGISKNDNVIIFVGRVAKEKNIDIIIKQLPKIITHKPNLKFLLVGDGPLLEELKYLAGELKILDNIIFAGEKPWNEIAIYYQLADVFVSASTSETQGLTYIEAMASKIPVVVKKDLSTKNLIIDEKTGFCFEKDDDFVQILLSILSDKEKLKNIADNAYENIQNLSAEKFGLNIQQVYYEAANKK